MEIQSEFIRRFNKVLNAKLSDPDLNGAALAGVMGMSRMHLHRHLRRYLNKSASEIIAHVRLTRGAGLLATTRLPVSQIADRVGYRDPGYFGRAFRQAYNISPSQFRSREEE